MFTEKELAELREYDKLVDKGIDLYPMTAEQKKASKQARATGTKTVYNFTKRERKPNESKRLLMRVLQDALTACECPTEIVNPEREMTFTWDGVLYRLTLSAPRVKKEG